MPDYKPPDDCIEQINKGSKSIERVSTTTAGFVGLAEKGVNNKAVLITSWDEFVQEFGRYTPETPYLAPTVWGFFENGGRRCGKMKDYV